jgi:hypothetical protein
MELLILLLEKDGQVASRQEIIERLWGKDVFVDTEHGINTAIRKIRAALREDVDHLYISPYFIAREYALLGRKEETLRYLEDAYREHCVRLVWLQNEGRFDFLHSDPRYRALVTKIGLPPAY